MFNKKIIHTVFEKVASENPNRIAIETEDTSLSYSDLNNKSNQFRFLLASLECIKGDVIGVFFDEAWCQIVALIGIFKAQGVYLPIDDKFKLNHWKEIKDNLKPKVLLVSENNYYQIKEYLELFNYTKPILIIVKVDSKSNFSFDIIYHDENGTQKKNSSIPDKVDNQQCSLEGDDSNYIFFTSGSTGNPKAVLGQHKSLSHFIHWESEELNINQNDIVGQLTSFSFDASLRDIFTALINGAKIVIPPKRIKENVFDLVNWIQKSNITLLHTTPTIFRLLMTVKESGNYFCYFSDLKNILLAGEKLYARDINKWRELFGDNSEIINLYGATESTLVKTFSRIKNPLDEKSLLDVLHVGKPISNTTILIINGENELCEINEIGEIFIKTPFLSKGYYNDPKLTAEKFVKSPFKDEIIYKTGDYGKYDIDRNVIVIGRKDGLVKNNGVRIDLNYIEKVLLQFTSINEVKCLFEEINNSKPILICFYSAISNQDQELKEYCLKYLSSYENPVMFFHLDKFPTNINGKTDVDFLKQKAASFYKTVEKEERNFNKEQQALMQLWEEVLELKEINSDLSFLSLGGDSIKLIRLKSLINKVFNVEVSLQNLFNHPTFKEHYDLIVKSNQSAHSEILKIQNHNNGYELSSSQERIWISSQIPEISIAYNMPSLVYLNGNYSIPDFTKAIHQVIKRHEILRTVFKIDSQGKVKQWVLPFEELIYELKYFDYKNIESPELKVEEYVTNDSDTLFDLKKGPLIRATIFCISDEQYMFYYNMHHIISDGISKEILKNEVIEIYQNIINKSKVSIEELNIQYKDYAQWQKEKLNGVEMEVHKKYWLDKFNFDLPRTSFPFKKNNNLIRTSHGQRIGTTISPSLFYKIKEYSTYNQGSIFMFIVAVFNVVLYKYTKKTDFVIGTPSFGRNHVDLKNQIGCYINILPLRLIIDENLSFDNLFYQVKTTMIDNLTHEDYPFDKLINDLKIPFSLDKNPLFDIMISYHNFFTKKDYSILDLKEDEIEYMGKTKIKLDMIMNFIENEKDLFFTVDFNTNLYNRDSIEDFIQNFKDLMKEILTSSSKPINNLDFTINTAQKIKSNNSLKLQNISKKINYGK